MNSPKPPQAAISGATSLQFGGRCAPLRGREPVDDAAEQQRLGELREGDGDIGRDQRQRQRALGAQLGEHAGVELEGPHRPGLPAAAAGGKPRAHFSPPNRKARTGGV